MILDIIYIPLRSQLLEVVPEITHRHERQDHTEGVGSKAILRDSEEFENVAVVQILPQQRLPAKGLSVGRPP